MDSKISLNVKKLIELDQKSVAMEKEWESQLKGVEDAFKREMEEITNSLQQTKLEAKRIYAELVEKAQDEVKLLSGEAENKLLGIEKKMTSAVDGLAVELWDKIKDGIK